MSECPETYTANWGGGVPGIQRVSKKGQCRPTESCVVSSERAEWAWRARVGMHERQTIGVQENATPSVDISRGHCSSMAHCPA